MKNEIALDAIYSNNIFHYDFDLYSDDEYLGLFT